MSHRTQPDASASHPPTDTAPLPNRPATLAGIALLLAAVSCFAILDTTTKRVSIQVPLIMAIWFRYFFQAVVTTLLALRQYGNSALVTRYPGLQLVRGLLTLLVTLAAFLSLKYMPVGEFTAIAMTTPMLVTLLASRLLGEQASWVRTALVLGGFAGTLLIVHPGSQTLGWMAALPLIFVIANTSFQLLTSHLARRESAMTIQLYTSWLGTLLVSLPLYWYWIEIDSLRLWLELVIMGTASAGGHLLLIMAFKRAPAATLMPYMYTQIGLGMLGGWLMFDHIPARSALLGMGLIAGCGIASAYLSYLEWRAMRGELAAPAPN